MKYYEGKNNTNFDCDKVPKEGSQCICVSVILIDYVFRIGKTYYPDVLLEKFKYIVKQKGYLNILLCWLGWLLFTLNINISLKTWIIKFCIA